jgi:hypothetical protein
MKPLCSGMNVSINAGSNARTSPDLPDQQIQLTGRSPTIMAVQSISRLRSERLMKAILFGP